MILVINTDEMEKTKAFFEAMGLTFVEEQHGKGPVHFAAEVDDNVLEIYPLNKYGEKKVYFYKE